jgi:hypothetical protein
MMSKPIIRSVAVVIQDESGRFLAVKRDENDDSKMLLNEQGKISWVLN